jgi:hypothetical protein
MIASRKIPKASIIALAVAAASPSTINRSKTAKLARPASTAISSRPRPATNATRRLDTEAVVPMVIMH